jgi:hypothetical protein
VHRYNEWDWQQHQQLNVEARIPIANQSMYGLHERMLITQLQAIKQQLLQPKVVADEVFQRAGFVYPDTSLM